MNNFNLFNDLRKAWCYFIIDNKISEYIYFLIRYFQRQYWSVSINFFYWISFLLPQAFLLSISSLFKFNSSTLSTSSLFSSTSSLLINLISLFFPFSLSASVSLCLCLSLSFLSLCRASNRLTADRFHQPSFRVVRCFLSFYMLRMLVTVYKTMFTLWKTLIMFKDCLKMGNW